MKNEKGITLIALVVTIIVVLILAGVTIANISGNESVPDKAAKVKSDAEIQDLQNKIEMALITVFNENKELDIASVKKAVLNKFNNATIKSTDFPLEVVIDGTSFWIEADNNVTNNIYTPKEYIKSTGTQYIDTGVNPANTVDFEITLKTDVDSMSPEYKDSGKTNTFFGGINIDLNRIIAINFSATKRRYQNFNLEK